MEEIQEIIIPPEVNNNNMELIMELIIMQIT